MKYVAVIERCPNNYSAYVPELPGCIAAADARDETLELIREGIAVYIEALIEFDEPLPERRISLTEAMADYLSTGDGYHDPETGVYEKYDYEDTEVAFVMVEVEVDLPLAKVAAETGSRLEVSAAGT